MTYLTLYPILRWACSNSSRKYLFFGSNFPYCYNYNFKCNHRFFSLLALRDGHNEVIEGTLTSNNGETIHSISPTIRKEAQSALLDYLHSTRSLPFLDAEHMSKNSPRFLKKLIENMNYETDIRRSLARFLRYNPINEFEPFFESIGLQPFEFVNFLPRGLMFLSDEGGLIDNCCILCEYGVARSNIGKIYKEAREVFRYGDGVLLLKLQDFEAIGMSKAAIGKTLSLNPKLLIGDVGKGFCKVVGKLQSLDCEYDWIEQQLFENGVYHWNQIFEALNVLCNLVCNKQELRYLVRQHPELLFDCSGKSTFLLFGFMLKFGSTKHDICSMLLNLPQIKVGKFNWNLRRAFELLCELKMDSTDVRNIIRTHFIVLGSLTLKKANSIFCNLNIGKKRLCKIIVANPLELKNWGLGAKIERLPGNKETRSRIWKVKFLSSIGFSENSKEMERALKAFRGKGEELHERFACFVRVGLTEEDATKMIKVAPQILNQSKEVIDTKITYLVSDLGYPVSSLRSFPRYMTYTTERVKLRCSMYRWLVNHNAVCPTLTLSTIISCTESCFVKKYVVKHPRGLDTWQKLKKTIYG